MLFRSILFKALTLPGGGPGLNAIKSALQEYLRERNGFFSKLSLSTIDNSAWKSFKAVSHLHLAYVVLLATHGWRPYPFPCQVNDLPVFLKTAESIRRQAEHTPLRQRAGMLLDSKRTWKVPSACLDDAESLWPLAC